MPELSRLWSTAVFTTVFGTAPRVIAEEAHVAHVDVVGVGRSSDRANKDGNVAGATIEREELAAPGLRIAERLRAQAGVQVTETGGFGSPSTASIRGATAAQTPVYLAGIRLNDDVGGGADLSQVPLWLIRRVEIYRGNAPLEADRMGIGGAIFFEPRWPKKSSAAVSATLGSYGTRACSAFGAIGSERGAVLFGIRTEHADNDYRFVDDHGTLLAPTGTSFGRMQNADVTTHDGWLIGRAAIGDGGTLDAFANVIERSQGVPTLALVPSRGARAFMVRGLSGLRSRTFFGDGWSLVAQSSALTAGATYDDPLEELALAARRIHLRGARVDQRLALRKDIGSSFTVRTALDVSSETLARDDDGIATLRARRLFARTAAAAQLKIGPISIAPLVALECHGTSLGGAPDVCSTIEPVGRMGLSIGDESLGGFVNVGRYARVPTLGELHGMSPLVRGNPALRPESGKVIDAGLRARGETAFAGLVAFVRWADDLVGFVRSSQGFVMPLNVSRARVAGLEAQAGVTFFGWMMLDGTATLLDARDVSPDRRTANSRLPFQSPLVVAPRIAAETRKVGCSWLSTLRAELRWLHQSSRYADAAGLAVIPAQDSLDAEVLAQTPEERLTLRLRMTDLADARRFDVVGFPLPGRSFFASLEAQW